MLRSTRVRGVGGSTRVRGGGSTRVQRYDDTTVRGWVRGYEGKRGWEYHGTSVRGGGSTRIRGYEATRLRGYEATRALRV